MHDPLQRPLSIDCGRTRRPARCARLRDYQTVSNGALCPNCKRRLRVVRRFRRWRLVRACWFATLCLWILPLSILLAPVMWLTLPCIASFLFALGPLNTLINEAERCAFCRFAVARKVELEQRRKAPRSAEAEDAVVLRMAAFVIRRHHRKHRLIPAVTPPSPSASH